MCFNQEEFHMHQSSQGEFDIVIMEKLRIIKTSAGSVGQENDLNTGGKQQTGIIFLNNADRLLCALSIQTQFAKIL